MSSGKLLQPIRDFFSRVFEDSQNNEDITTSFPITSNEKYSETLKNLYEERERLLEKCKTMGINLNDPQEKAG